MRPKTMPRRYDVLVTYDLRFGAHPQSTESKHVGAYEGIGHEFGTLDGARPVRFGWHDTLGSVAIWNYRLELTRLDGGIELVHRSLQRGGIYAQCLCQLCNRRRLYRRHLGTDLP